ncbi:protein FAR-RED IMPAIRED RESPONSE 1-like [Beta vulgaris subsp. vulgaris]|uniref:protein FAR-RED IMPAIRED RESPONSE 1-like n=1 Tax=Beta vulgaris subsp. vulgaris TaxID=3555 RepID=UPI00053FC064|nr:protein FAR-RED IMPAIRED RESPONSE 1-like [Beta vulgaris subsp. vulgaris]
MIYASVNEEGLWEIRKAILQHENHNPTPSKVRNISKFRQEEVSCAVRRKLFNDKAAGVRISQIHKSIATDRNGLENMPITERDLRNIVAKERRLKFKDGDANSMLSYFDRMTDDNQQFFHMHRLDDEGHMKDVLWVDARSRAAYEYFGDVVCFDATYLTNDYALPFANFVGVNHHGQSILLGCAVISHEDAESYTWVFSTWVKCMGGKAPNCFLTDQDAAMRKALVNAMPGTWHRWCLWHILMKFGKKLGKYALYKEFKRVLLDAIYDSVSGEEFEVQWCDAISKYGLGEDKWLEGLYKERMMWAPAYMKHIFWAGMKTTQRSESINSFFDGYVHKNMKLCDFAEQYCNAMESRANSEKVADANSSRYVRQLATDCKAEVVFQKLYTDGKFKEVQAECLKMLYVHWRGVQKLTHNIEEHTFADRIWVICKDTKKEVPTNKRRNYRVKIDLGTFLACCECKMFEYHGILCRHIINLYDVLNIKEIPSQYILDRWRKDVIRKHTMIKVAYHDPSKTEEVMCYDKMMVLFDPICLKAAYCDEVDLVVEALKLLDDRINERKALKLTSNGPKEGTPSSVGNNTIRQDVTPGSVNMQEGVKDPPRKTRKGSRSVRFPSCIEKGQGSKKQKKGNKDGKVNDDEACNSESDDDEGHELGGQVNIWSGSS